MVRPLLRLVLALTLAGLIALILPERGNLDGWSLFPPVAAILVAISTGQLIVGLVIAILSGAVLTLPSSTPLYALPWEALRHATLDFFWDPLVNSFQFYILGFTAALIGMTRIIALAGGTQGIAELLVKRAAGARSTRLATFLMGLAIFFDDYANTMVVGTTMRPIADRFGISREKLAYLVDSTAAPVAGLAVVSTWIGYEVGLFDDVMRQVGEDISGYELFFRALPLRFYCILTLCFVALSTFLQRDFGPMLKAEQRASQTGQVLAPDARPMSGNHHDQINPPAGLRAHWSTAAAPVGLVIFSVILGMHLDVWNHDQATTARQQHGLFSRSYWMVVLSNADSAKVMFLASMAGSALAFFIALTRRDSSSGKRLFNPWQAFKVWIRAIRNFYYALIILVLAWAIKETCTAAGTSAYLIASLSDLLAPAILPVLVFLLAGIVAFSIGTSWTTMALLLPTMLPLAFEIGGLPLVVLAAAAVLDGAIFGDHCSPISDTTVLSSIASSCDHTAHVRTQIPYALATMSAAALFGYLGTTLLYPPLVGLLAGLTALILLLFMLGRDPEKPVT